ncbi:hypothetical protein LTR94_026145, partial [Friedmanniomyces endolithicus]
RVIEQDEGRRLVGVSIDVTAEYSAAETREMMIREMNHRVKNLFAIISSMIGLRARSHTSVPDFATDLRERIASLGRAHSLATPRPDADTVNLGELFRTVLSPYQQHASILIDGPIVQISRDHLSPLALIFHEWATNAAKYGGLKDGGGVTVSWEQSDDALNIAWTEELSAPFTASSDVGFGTRLIQSSVRQMGAETSTDVEGTDLTLRLKLPAK